MITTCVFYLNNRTKTITGKFGQDCWIKFKKDFGEALNELCKVKVIQENGTEIHLEPKRLFTSLRYTRK